MLARRSSESWTGRLRRVLGTSGFVVLLPSAACEMSTEPRIKISADGVPSDILFWYTMICPSVRSRSSTGHLTGRRDTAGAVESL